MERKRHLRRIIITTLVVSFAVLVSVNVVKAFSSVADSHDTNPSTDFPEYSISLSHDSQLLPMDDYNEDAYLKAAAIVGTAVSEIENNNPALSYVKPADCPKAYSILSEVKKDDLKYVLQCVLESREDGFVESFLVRTVFDLMNESNWETATRPVAGNNYTPDGPKYQAYNIYYNVFAK